jgi:hypothetical protein
VILRYFNDIAVEQVTNNFGYEFVEGVKKLLHKCDIKFCIKEIVNVNVSFDLPLITLEGTKKIIKSININKSPGEDNITIKDIIAGGDQIAEVLTMFVNKCITTSTYPDQLKTAIIRPIFKGGNHKIYSNYRPIAISDIIDKILQKHFTGNLTDYLSNNNLIHENQYAYQKGKSCTKLIIDFTDYVNIELEKNNHVLVIFVDFSKAFDTLIHEVVIQELENIGIIGPELELIKSYLKDRKIIVDINKVRSDAFEVKVGVGQGTNVSPILFLIYVNTLFSVLDKCRVFMFADDLAIIVSNNNFEDAQKILQNNINHLTNWAHDYGLLINIKKTKVLHIFNSYLRNNEIIKVIIHDNSCLHQFRQNCKCMEVEQVKFYLYLGVIIDQDFRWNLHILKVINKIKQVIPAIYNLKLIVKKSTIRNIYFALVHPFIIYSIVAWGFVESGPMTQLIKIKKIYILKVMKQGEKFKENEDIFKYWEILSVKDQAKMSLILDKYFEYHSELKTINYNTRLAEQTQFITPINM